MEYDHKCSICLESISERTKPTTCDHVFCMDCIYGWTKYTNVCPLCKVKITQLQIFNALNKDEIQEIIDVPEPPKPETDAMGELLNEFSNMCFKCNWQGDEIYEEQSLIVCDGCDFEVVHY